MFPVLLHIADGIRRASFPSGVFPPAPTETDTPCYFPAFVREDDFCDFMARSSSGFSISTYTPPCWAATGDYTGYF